MPPLALREGASGTVQIKVYIDETGSVVSASVASSSHNALLDKAALEAAEHSTYSAGAINCKPVGGAYLFIVTFRNGSSPASGFYLQMCAPINGFSGDRLSNAAAQLEYSQTVPAISEDKKQTTGLEERYAVAAMLADDLMVRDTVVPYNGCRAIVAASPILKQMPDVQDEIARAMTLPVADPSLENALQQLYVTAVSKLPANKETAAKLGAAPQITVIYRDRFGPLFGYDEIGVVRLENGAQRAYAPYSRKFGQLMIGSGGQMCVQGDTRCAPLHPILP